MFLSDHVHPLKSSVWARSINANSMNKVSVLVWDGYLLWDEMSCMLAVPVSLVHSKGNQDD